MTITTSAVNVNSQLPSPSVGSQSSARTAPDVVRNTVPTKEDTVALSPIAQKALAAPPAPQPTLDQIIKQAADGDLRALAQLALI